MSISYLWKAAQIQVDTAHKDVPASPQQGPQQVLKTWNEELIRWNKACVLILTNFSFWRLFNGDGTEGHQPSTQTTEMCVSSPWQRSLICTGWIRTGPGWPWWCGGSWWWSEPTGIPGSQTPASPAPRSGGAEFLKWARRQSMLGYWVLPQSATQGGGREAAPPTADCLLFNLFGQNVKSSTSLTH